MYSVYVCMYKPRHVRISVHVRLAIKSRYCDQIFTLIKCGLKPVETHIQVKHFGCQPDLGTGDRLIRNEVT